MIQCTGVLFDLDGTLLDSLEDLADATNAALGAAGYPQPPLEDYRQFVGSGLETLVRRALPPEVQATLTEETLRPLVQATAAYYGEHWGVKTRPYEGIPEVLETLVGKGIPVGIVTNKPHEWMLRIVAHFFPKTPFATTQGALPTRPHKPDPASAWQAAQELHLDPHGIAFVGDSDVDMLTARNAGMIAIGAAWGFRGEQELLQAGAAHVLQRPLELLSLME